MKERSGAKPSSDFGGVAAEVFIYFQSFKPGKMFYVLLTHG
jgi:hypothetical protein